MKKNSLFKIFTYLKVSVIGFLFCFYFKNVIKSILNVGFSFKNDILELYMLKNTGSAFSLFKDSNFTLAIIASVVTACIIFYVIKNAKSLNRLDIRALGFLTAGIVSNMLERFIDGYVTDYIKLTFVDFPVFNLADLFINIGAILLIISIILTKRNKHA